MCSNTKVCSNIKMCSNIKELKKILILKAENKPLTSEEVLKTSQELDRHILEVMKKQYNDKNK